MSKTKNLVERQQVENSPFTAIKHDDTWFLTMGKYRMTTKNFETFEQVTEWITLNQYELMATFCSIVCEETVREILNNKDNE